MSDTPQATGAQIEVICARVNAAGVPVVHRYAVPVGTTAAVLTRQTDCFQTDFDAAASSAHATLPPMGVFSRKLSDPEHYVLQDQDRLELYQPLILTPMEVRRARARVYPVGRRKPRANDLK